MKSSGKPHAIQRAYYSASIGEFCSSEPDRILGEMSRNNQFELKGSQRNAWVEQFHILKDALSEFTGTLFLEFNIPRMGTRVDAIAIIGSVVFVIEFKVGERDFHRRDLDQVVDYALDLHHFHEGSHHVVVAPLLICTEAAASKESIAASIPDSLVLEPSRVGKAGLSKAIAQILKLSGSPKIDVEQWSASSYKPTPTIIEATLHLFRHHSVEDISRHDAGRTNLTTTSSTLSQVIADSKRRGQKSICFVTGVPGAGKTLVGLKTAAEHFDRHDDLHCVFLSGNGPLVQILQEALARDRVLAAKVDNKKLRKGVALSEAKVLVQNVHHFRDDCIKDRKAPADRIAIFDEAQRAWNLKKTADFMKRKKGEKDFSQSEPAYLISCLGRHEGWAAIICLVGGGQEINDGEAGIGEWLRALEKHPEWKVYVSDRLTDSEYSAEADIARLRSQSRVLIKSDLHLATSIRSFRSEKVSQLVKEILDLDLVSGRESMKEILDRYPIVLTRDLESARRWLRYQAKGNERFGIVVSSEAERLKPLAVNVRTAVDPVHWFLGPKEDVRSSYYLEDVATEFQVQGLELDWTCVVWDADFRYSQDGWRNWSFRGDRWVKIHVPQDQRYQKNAYRVLLTRARQGMVIVVPDGNPQDPTRDPSYYDPTFDYLKRCGIPALNLK